MPKQTPRQRDADATRTALIDVGARRFALDGYSGCRNQRIADEAGVNKAMINYHFGGKLGLYRAVVAEAVDATRPLVEAFRAEARTLDGAGRMAEWIRTLDRCFQTRPHLPGLLMREHLDGGSRLQAEFRERLSQFFLTTAWVLDPDDSLPDRADVDAHSVHLALVGALSFYLVSQPFRERAEAGELALAPAPERARYIDYLVRLHRAGLFTPTTDKGHP